MRDNPSVNQLPNICRELEGQKLRSDLACKQLMILETLQDLPRLSLIVLFLVPDYKKSVDECR